MDDGQQSSTGFSDDDKTTLGNMFRFLGTLHQRCENSPDTVLQFLNLAREFQEGVIGLDALKEQIERLFVNYPDSITSFRRCFEGVEEDGGREGTPVQFEERKRPLSTYGQGGSPAPKMRKLDVKDALAFLDKIKLRYQSEPAVYNAFLDIMRDFRAQSIDTPTVVKKVGRIFADEPDLIENFNVFLPEGYEVRREGSRIVLCRL